MICGREPGGDDDDETPGLDLPELQREEAERALAKRVHTERTTTAPESAAALEQGGTAVYSNGRRGGARVVTMAGVTPKGVEWLWPGRLPAGMVAVLDGAPGTGKSTVVLDLVARLTTGRPLPNESGGSRTPTAVVLIGNEDSPEHTIRPRLDAAGADPAQVHLLADIGGRPPRLPDDGEEIERVVREMGAQLLVIDPVSAYIGHADFHRDNEVRGALAPLARIGETTGATVLMLRHLRKTGGIDAIGRGLGSVATIAVSRAGLMLLRDPDDAEARILAWPKLSVAPVPRSLRLRLQAGDGAPRITWEGTCDLTADDILARQDRAHRGGGEDAATAADAAETWLMTYLGDRSDVPAAEILAAARAQGITETTLRRAQRRLGIRPRQVGVPGRRGGGEWHWYAPQRNQAPAAKWAAGDCGSGGDEPHNSTKHAELCVRESDATESDATGAIAPDSAARPASDGAGAG